jgi:Mg2+ and Co2+ transporter CorA
MNHELQLSEAERGLMVELLQRELDELHVEIHHSRTSTMTEELRQRREVVRSLMERLQPAAAMA